MSCRCDDNDAMMVDSNGCFTCIEVPKVKGRFGLAWVSESPECRCPEPVGWQVEFLDTPSKVEQKCQEMVRWINCPPLPRCDPCPPDELCCGNPARCNPCAPKTNPCQPKCSPCQPCQQQQKPKCSCSVSPRRQSKNCCCCTGQQRPPRRCFPPPGTPYCRARSPRRGSRGCSCDNQQEMPKCTCDDIPTKDTNMGGSAGTYNNYNTSSQQYYNNAYSPTQVTTNDGIKCNCSKPTVTLYQNQNNNQYHTDTEYSHFEINNDGNKKCVPAEKVEKGAKKSRKCQEPCAKERKAGTKGASKQAKEEKSDVYFMNVGQGITSMYACPFMDQGGVNQQQQQQQQCPFLGQGGANQQQQCPFQNQDGANQQQQMNPQQQQMQQDMSADPCNTCCDTLEGAQLQRCQQPWRQQQQQQQQQQPMRQSQQMARQSQQPQQQQMQQQQGQYRTSQQPQSQQMPADPCNTCCDTLEEAQLQRCTIPEPDKNDDQRSWSQKANTSMQQNWDQDQDGGQQSPYQQDMDQSLQQSQAPNQAPDQDDRLYGQKRCQCVDEDEAENQNQSIYDNVGQQSGQQSWNQNDQERDACKKCCGGGGGLQSDPDDSQRQQNWTPSGQQSPNRGGQQSPYQNGQQNLYQGEQQNPYQVGQQSPYQDGQQQMTNKAKQRCIPANPDWQGEQAGWSQQQDGQQQQQGQQLEVIHGCWETTKECAREAGEYSSIKSSGQSTPKYGQTGETNSSAPDCGCCKCGDDGSLQTTSPTPGSPSIPQSPSEAPKCVPDCKVDCENETGGNQKPPEPFICPGPCMSGGKGDPSSKSMDTLDLALAEKERRERALALLAQNAPPPEKSKIKAWIAPLLHRFCFKSKEDNASRKNSVKAIDEPPADKNESNNENPADK